MSSIEDILPPDILFEKPAKIYTDDDEEERHEEEEVIPSTDSEGGDSWIIIGREDTSEEEEEEESESEEEEEEPLSTSSGLPSITDDIPDDEIPNTDFERYVWTSEETMTREEEEDEDPNSKSEWDRISEISYSYSTNEELPDQFAQIRKGITYIHKPNRELNVFLSGTVIIGVAIVLGFGYGHFLGWSERLEVYEFVPNQFEDLEPECPLQDPGDYSVLSSEAALIRRLQEENRELKDEIELSDSLRDQIDQLISANTDLEREVEELRTRESRLSSSISSEKSSLERTLNRAESDLNLVLRNFDRLANENQLLKEEVDRAVGSNSKTSVEEKRKINQLMTENDELKQEVRKMRYGGPPPPPSPPVEPHSFKPDFTNEEPSSFEPDYVNYIKDLFVNSTQSLFEPRGAIEIAKNRVSRELKPIAERLGSELFGAWNKVKSFTRKQHVKERFAATRKVVGKLSDVFYSALDDVKDFGKRVLLNDEDEDREDWFKGPNNDWPFRNRAKPRKESRDDWMLGRWRNREKIRRKEARGEWFFDRAQRRKRSHAYADSDWYYRKILADEECRYNDCALDYNYPEYKNKRHDYKKNDFNKQFQKKKKFAKRR